MNSKRDPLTYILFLGLAIMVGFTSILPYVPLSGWYLMGGSEGPMAMDGCEFFRNVIVPAWFLYPIFPIIGVIGSPIAWKIQHTRLAYSLLLLTLVPYLLIPLMFRVPQPCLGSLLTILR